MRAPISAVDKHGGEKMADDEALRLTTEAPREARRTSEHVNPAAREPVPPSAVQRSEAVGALSSVHASKDRPVGR